MFTNFPRKWPVFKKGVRLNFTSVHQFSSKIASFQIGSAPQFHEFSSKNVYFQKRNVPQVHQIWPMFTNFRRKWSVFQIRSAPQFHQFSPIFVENGKFSKKECALISRIFVDKCLFSKKVRLKFTNFDQFFFFTFCWDKLDYPGSIVYLSCLVFFL